MKHIGKFDYLLVGQGLAGTILALKLLQKGKKIALIDCEDLPASSRVAAGIFNPITGKYLTPTWLMEEIFESLRTFYTEAEKDLNSSFFYPTTHFRPFTSEEQISYFKKQIERYQTQQHIEILEKSEDIETFIKQPFGGLYTHGAGWVDVPFFLQKVKQVLQEKAVFLERKFDFKKLHFSNNDVFEYENLLASKIVFCEGFYCKQNPYFNWLPFLAVKGEVLDVELEENVPTSIINQGVFLLPHQQKGWRVGATYDWDNLNNDCTEQGKTLLCHKMEAFVQKKYTVKKQMAGVRPATYDRRPFVGQHPEQKNMYIFNGLGTKGVSIAPYFAQQLLDFMEEGKEINPEANIERYYSLYFDRNSSKNNK